MTGALETALRTRREAGGKSLVPYLTGGLGDDWLETIQAVADAGADRKVCVGKTDKDDHEEDH